MTPARGFARQLERVIARKTERDRVVVNTRVVGRNRDGTLQTQRIDGGLCAERGCVGPESVGSVVQRSPRCQANSAGASGSSVLNLAGAGGLVRIEGIEPDSFARGSSVTVEVSGLGFGDRTELAFGLLEVEDFHPGISIEEVRVIDQNTLEVDIEVDDDAETVSDAPVLFGTGHLGLRTGPIYSVTAETVEPRFLILFDNGSEAILYRFGDDGSQVDELARGPASQHYAGIFSADGRYLGWDGQVFAATTIRAVIPATSSVAERATPAGITASAPGVGDNRVRWWEFDAASSDSSTIEVRLKTATFDLNQEGLTATAIADDEQAAPPGSGVIWLPALEAPMVSHVGASISLQSFADFESATHRVYALFNGETGAAIPSPDADPVGRPIGTTPESYGFTNGGVIVTETNAAGFEMHDEWPGPGPAQATGISLAAATDGSIAILKSGGIVELRSAVGDVISTATLDTEGATGTPVAIYPLF